jgi:paraquat-inducible protein A
VEVFFLAVLVALVRLTSFAVVEVGPGLWCFAALMLLMAAIGANFDPRELWARASAR